MFKNPQDVKNYVLAGNAAVTLTSKRTGKRYTYKITRATNRETREPEDRWFVALLAGPDNTADYTYLGMLNGSGMLAPTKASRMGVDSIPFRGFNYLWRHIKAGELPADMEIRHMNTCGRCGRPLTVPESIDTGLGPECADILGVPWRTKE
jgi:hypothetical protein